MQLGACQLQQAKAFTFHYGSILIFSLDTVEDKGQIYIPLWFYSNIASDIASAVPPSFTFHYGSILIRCTDISYVAYKNMVDLSTLFFYS